MEENDKQCTQTSENVVGGGEFLFGINGVNSSNVGIDSNIRLIPISALILMARANRPIYSQFKIYSGELMALSIVWTYFWMNGRQGGGIKAIIDWSGANAGWKKQVRFGINDCLKKGLMEWKSLNNGKSLRISEKGYRIIDIYNYQIKETNANLNQRKLTKSII